MESINGEEVVARLEDASLYLTEKHLYRKTRKAYDILCEYLRNTGSVTFEDGITRGHELEFLTIEGELKKITIRSSELLQPRNLMGTLMNRGFRRPEAGHFDAICTFLSKVSKKRHIRKIDTSGWNIIEHGGARHNYFAIGSDVYGPEIKGFTVQLSERTKDDLGFEAKGSLEDWKENVGGLCRGNPIAIFVVCNAFAAPLLRPSRIDPDLIHLDGTSSVGKTTLLYVALSIFGDPGNCIASWKSTGTGFEGLCRHFCDLPLAINELGQADPNTLYDAIYTVEGRKGKARGNIDASLKIQTAFRNKVISSGEVSVADQLKQGKRSITRGQEIRFVEVKVTEKNSFPDIHESDSSEEFATLLRANTTNYHGVIGRMFIQHVVQNCESVESKLTKFLPKCVEYLEEKVSDLEISNAEKRALRRVALTAFSGEFATQLGLTGWEHGDAREAVATLFRRWLKQRRSASEMEQKVTLGQVRARLEKSIVAPLKEYDDDDQSPNTIFRHIDDGEKTILVKPKQFKHVICEGQDPTAVKKALLDAKFLITDRGRTDKQVRIPDSSTKVTFIAIRKAFLRSE